MNRVATALVGAGCAALVAVSVSAHPNHDLVFVVPGAGVVQGVDLYDILVRHFRSQGCIVDMVDREATTAKARAAVARALGLTGDQVPPAIPAIDAAIGQTMDVMMNDGVIMVNRQTNAATLAGCGLD